MEQAEHTFTLRLSMEEVKAAMYGLVGKADRMVH